LFDKQEERDVGNSI